MIGKDKIRIGMEAAYAPYNWQVSEASEYTIPIDNVQGAYADGYDVQIAKIVCKALGGEPVAVKQSFSGLIDSLNNGQIDLIIAGMSATPEREESVGFSDPYFIGYFGLFVKEGSPYQNATKLSDFSGATVLGQKDTMLDTVIDEIPGASTRTRSIRSPRCLESAAGHVRRRDLQHREREGLYGPKSRYRPHPFAEGEGFKQEVAANVGCRKGSDKLLKLIDKTLKGVSQEERDQMWDACLDRQPA